MDYGRPELADRLAAEYVLGTLRGPARRRFENLLGAHPALRGAVADWQVRLSPLEAGVQPVEPPESVWRGIESRLFTPAAQRASATGAASPPQDAGPGPGRGWGVRLWQGLAGLASAAVVVLAVLLAQPAPVQPPIVVVLEANPEAAATLQARFVASVSGDGRALVLRPIGALALDPGRVLELWAVPATGAPRSLGLVQGAGDTRLLRARLLDDTAALAVSVEPPGGSPTGAPSGPIVSVGRVGT